jgi:hypothetical protein
MQKVEEKVNYKKKGRKKEKYNNGLFLSPCVWKESNLDCRVSNDWRIRKDMEGSSH